MDIIPYLPNDNILRISILTNGEENGLTTFLKKIVVHFELNKIPTARLNFISSNPNISEETNLESDLLNVRDEIEIKVSWGDEGQTLFKGIIFKIEKNLDPDSGYETKIECKDICIDLTSEQEFVDNENFEDRMNRFLQNVSISNTVDLETYGSAVITQTHNTTPWDYLLGYLDSLGKMTSVRNGEFSVSDITKEDVEAKFVASYGVNIIEFQGKKEEADTASRVVIQYWNPNTQSVEEQESSVDSNSTQRTETISISQASYSPEIVDRISKASASRNKWSGYNGKVIVPGNQEVICGEYIKFENVNEEINDRSVLITSEHHTIENGNWTTEYAFGLENNKTFAETIANATTSTESMMGQTNSMQGLQIAIVTQIEGDPRDEFRIRVRIPAISDTGEGVWARLSSVQAGNNRGGFFIPEIGDEVVLGCFNNNPDTPVILGKLYSSAAPPPFTISDSNHIQGIVSKEGTKIVINDEELSVEISTRNGNKILVSDNQSGLIMEDENGNKIQLNRDGITLDSSKDIKLNANGNIDMEGINTNMAASGMMELKGSLININ